MTNFNEWLNSQMYKTSIALLPENEDITIDIPEDEQIKESHDEEMTCNKCPVGHTTVKIITKEINFTLKHGDIFEGSNLSHFTEAELRQLGRLVEQGIIKPRYRRNEQQELEQLQINGEYTTNF